MTICLTGDIHGKPQERFSFKHHPTLRELGQNDIMIILGDFGLPFGINAPWFNKDEELYNIKWLNEKPWTTIALCGNHDDRTAIEQMPIVEKCGGTMRQMMFDGTIFKNIFIIDTPQVLDIENEHCLVIPGAESHDIYSGILDPEEEQFERILNEWARDPSKRFRIKDWTWWENEDVDIEATKKLLNKHKDDFFDMILTHECPALFNQIATRSECMGPPTEGRLFLEELRKDLVFDSWFHGHCHVNKQYPKQKEFVNFMNEIPEILPGDDRIMCLFNWICEV